MGIEIFRHESGATETWLVVNDDGPVTYVTENTGWRMARRGMERTESSMTAKEAKERWSSYTENFDEALARLCQVNRIHSEISVHCRWLLHANSIA